MRGKPWGAEAEEILKAEAGRLPAEEIGRRTGHTADTVIRRMKAAGLTPYHPARRLRLMADAAGLNQHFA